MTIETIKRIIEEENVRFIRLQFTDINGTLKNLEITPDVFLESWEDGIMFDGSSIEGFVRIEESDMYLKPVLDTFAVLPWTVDGAKSARVICDVYTPDGKPFEGDPRYRLRRMMEKAEQLGYTPYAGPEMEFFILPINEKGEPVPEFLDHGGYFDLLPLSKVEEIRRDIAIALEKMGITVEATHHEVAPSQHEVDFRYDTFLRTADNAQTVKLVIKTMAIFHGYHATFMPKPFYGVNGSGMHVHMSLFRGDKNAFYDPDDPLGLSKELRYFVGGILKHAKALAAVTNPTINSYKRLVPGYEAPVYISWSVGNRSALIRIPKARGKATRLEYRSPDPSCNIYLAFAAILAAGLDGIINKIEPPAPVEENIYHMTSERREELNIESLPGSLKEAVEELKKDDVIIDALGEHIFEKFVEAAEKDWKEFSTYVTNWELQRYLYL
ncbi:MULTISPECIES: type I glutamate--ammonia ligase [Thermotoga]|uniref:Glutamine synthetase n=2 Tax=Thermotoga TaxID=2335 RepID=GLN1A_THEMA|nr:MULTISPECIES: type I glutamate--ammonia ligase [Thermotoga]P36205.2 RecName: Full=Glutamine synthetase; Short=GS; AltName: Full=Glutamate--ammonia ligase; AltName: Full=Glutamine synthetase I alpha; Short=GSI alpha [Thermotoga maritima MSB8]AAD36024.1 glutamine synthetase [Thermotoga maritima MSB8]ACM23809.1 Glutamine synthetase [Thermotoga neapolitana DSM 4359]AGL49870.1 Glutamine synthetase type I [Thermotoga maritima MSB8]AHD19143.1 glutamine synthetase [Thermotoga maritima MSB8]AKE2685